MGYTPTFQPMYEDGWEDLPLETTPIQAEALNNYDEAIEHIEDYLASDASQANLADSYDPDEGTYAVGDYAIYEGTLYKCTTPVSEPEDFDSDKWESCLITDEMGHGGGGSDVSITPTLSTGTKIADFEIDGVEGELYAPTGGGGSANIWTGTMAEYEAQASQIPNDTLVNITDDEGEIEVGGEYYSTEERCVGTWTNGKPLYQKTYTGLSISLSTNSWTTLTGVTITNGEDLVNADCYGEYTEQYLLNCTKVHLNSANGSVEIRNIESSTTLTAITLTYTKTTDSAIPLAVKTTPSYEVYSTDEQIIGQWVDGSPIYRKTVNTGAIPNNINKSVAHGISNLGRVINVCGNAKNTTYNYYIPLPYSQTDVTYQVAIYCDNTNIHLITSRDMSGYNESYVTIEYTKTSS